MSISQQHNNDFAAACEAALRHAAQHAVQPMARAWFRALWKKGERASGGTGAAQPEASRPQRSRRRPRQPQQSEQKMRKVK
jgi:hypothetical protein